MILRLAEGTVNGSRVPKKGNPRALYVSNLIPVTDHEELQRTGSFRHKASQVPGYTGVSQEGRCSGPVITGEQMD
ncbi:MAG: hypothetical protein JXA44_04940 [Methanospirillaceae archaeon]|nr:hypothetical protein [Methanospirillaceae archaeon]